MNALGLLPALGFLGLGLLTGAFGTLIGAGGGFVLMPVLLLIFPHEDPALLTSISLAVVFVNAASGTQAYAAMHRVDYKSGVAFALAGIPGAVLGALSTTIFPRAVFDTIFGAIFTCGAVFIALGRIEDRPKAFSKSHGLTWRRLVDSEGQAYEYAFSMPLGVTLAAFIGVLSSFLGIGGGIIHVPVMVYALGFPVHVATATSHFVLAVMALAGTITHIASGEFTAGVHRTLYLSLGVLAGAQIGAHLSNHMRGRVIMRGLALALALLGLRILYLGITG